MDRVMKRDDYTNRENPAPPGGGLDIAGAIRRGGIYSAVLPDCAGEGGKISGPVLVIQNDVGNRYSRSIIVACLTSKPVTSHFPVIVGIPQGIIPGMAAICLNQIMTVDKSRLREKIANLPPETMAGVDEALRLSLGLPRRG